jgi:hypothetical protein
VADDFHTVREWRTEVARLNALANDERLARLDRLRQRVAREHLGDERYAERLRGDDLLALREDAETLRDQLGLPARGRPSPEAALFVLRRERRGRA